MDADPRHLPWDACFNARDLGGLPTRDGGTTRWRALIRSDNLCRLTRHGRLALARYGIRTAIDLRDSKELPLEHDPFAREELAEVSRIEIPQLTPDFWSVWRSSMTPHEGDLLTIETCRGPIAAMFEAIAAAPTGGIVVYCHAGRDRTGIAAALLLALAGVDPGTISREQAIGDRYLAPLFAAWAESQEEPERKARLPEAFHGDPEQMRLTLAALDELYGGIERYLLDSGVKLATIGHVRDRLVA